MTMISRIINLSVRLNFGSYIFSFALSCGDGTQCICKPNYLGDRCEFCGPGYFGQPEVLGTV